MLNQILKAMNKILRTELLQRIYGNGNEFEFTEFYCQDTDVLKNIKCPDCIFFIHSEDETNNHQCVVDYFDITAIKEFLDKTDLEFITIKDIDPFQKK